LSDNYSAQIILYSAYVDEDLQAAARDLGLPAIDKSDNERLLEVVRGMVAATPA
jgi:hypothetical protein